MTIRHKIQMACCLILARKHDIITIKIVQKCKQVKLE